MSTVKKVRLDFYAEQINSRYNYLAGLIVKDAEDVYKELDNGELVESVNVDQDEVLITIGDLQTALKELRELIK